MQEKNSIVQIALSSETMSETISLRKYFEYGQNVPLEKDLLPPFPEEKKKHLVQSLVPTSWPCPGCYKITTIFSHAQIVISMLASPTVLSQATGGKARLTEGCSFRWKQH
ncbi:PREDICTED: 40S ribosomal protein S27-like [Odobenus rosmarus divergens]|uniref:40S ribosomal protein S27-like n=1 Tax=Odobenus rosmarus divergens TaxID=9708 RepID=A0A2U3WUT0_ODORO|nr:PREDICTED: 40S ribosomal protein S27-like [Odobenus rosmarus divergens]